MSNETFRAGARTLARMGLSLDVMLSFPQLNELAEFARAVPEVSIILNHVGGVSRTGIYAGKDDEVIPTWRDGISAVAECPNVTCKLGGLGMPRWGVRLGRPDRAHRIRRTGRGDDPVDDPLH